MEEDVEEWLRVSLPILEGPFASKPWIKYVLKVISVRSAIKNFTYKILTWTHVFR
ncbi:hypothetical protein TKV_c11130 [Thermoanaerobacter kivui]|uniref:Uncharacterized protein n=2 Tax=Thermoanaerobacter kivui TaxID=2325 RepID=A0A097AR35_THEKI|nr:hypothetical protein TKV_c11130 [Thermoanaerobacter kivui]